MDYKKIGEQAELAEQERELRFRRKLIEWASKFRPTSKCSENDLDARAAPLVWARVLEDAIEDGQFSHARVQAIGISRGRSFLNKKEYTGLVGPDAQQMATALAKKLESPPIEFGALAELYHDAFELESKIMDGVIEWYRGCR